jgi:hypothetical protein
VVGQGGGKVGGTDHRKEVTELVEQEVERHGFCSMRWLRFS